MATLSNKVFKPTKIMSEFHKYLIIYSAENQPIAEDLSAQLQQTGHEAAMLEKASTDYSEQIGQINLPDQSQVIFLLTDNFLKSYGCMNGILQATHKWGDDNRLQVVVANGVEYNEDEEPVEVETEFERVGDIINYMNYWQDKYLTLRKKKRNRKGNEDLDEQLAITKKFPGRWVSSYAMSVGRDTSCWNSLRRKSVLKLNKAVALTMPPNTRKNQQPVAKRPPNRAKGALLK